jgi:hypothetical protein
MLPRRKKRSKLCVKPDLAPFCDDAPRIGGPSGGASGDGTSPCVLVDGTANVPFAVGTTIADRPPHRSVRAELPHTAPTLDVLRQIARQDMDAGYGVEESTVRRSVADGPIPVAAADYDGAKPAATACTDDPGIAATPRCYPAQRDNGNNLPRPVSATRPRRSPAHASSGATPASTTAASPSSASPRFAALRQNDPSGSPNGNG